MPENKAQGSNVFYLENCERRNESNRRIISYCPLRGTIYEDEMNMPNALTSGYLLKNKTRAGITEDMRQSEQGKLWNERIRQASEYDREERRKESHRLKKLLNLLYKSLPNPSDANSFMLGGWFGVTACLALVMPELCIYPALLYPITLAINLTIRLVEGK